MLSLFTTIKLKTKNHKIILGTKKTAYNDGSSAGWKSFDSASNREQEL